MSPKKKTPPATAFGFPVLLIIMGGNQARKGLPQHHELLKQLFCCETRPSGLHKPQATAELKQVIAEIPHDGCAVPVKGMPTKGPPLCGDLGAIGVAEGN